MPSYRDGGSHRETALPVEMGHEELMSYLREHLPPVSIFPPAPLATPLAPLATTPPAQRLRGAWDLPRREPR